MVSNVVGKSNDTGHQTYRDLAVSIFAGATLMGPEAR